MRTSINRRQWLKRAGLFVPATFAILRAKADTIVVVQPVAAAGGGDGPNTWYYCGTGKTESSFTGVTNTGWAPQTYNYGADVSVAQAGTCTTISIKAGGADSGITLKIGLFNSVNNLVANGSVAVPWEAPGWRDVTISAAVTTGTYKILGSFSSISGIYGTDSGQDGIYDEVAYASFPPGSITPTVESGTIYSVRMYVD